jgi:hypothetical protein
MITTNIRNNALALVATAGIALTGTAFIADAAHAQPAGGGSGSSKGRNCQDGDQIMGDGDVKIYRGKNQRSSTTCTDGTVCESRGVKQGDGSWMWFYDCKDSPARTVPGHGPHADGTRQVKG